MLELGAGIGLPSLLMASEAKTIQISDYDLEAVELLQKNIKHLQLQNVRAMQLDWNTIPEKPLPVLPAATNTPSTVDGLSNHPCSSFQKRVGRSGARVQLPSCTM